ncbi:Clavaminate synthase-like protein, partial [Wilcoxina mikolae CBS 423.85]
LYLAQTPLLDTLPALRASLPTPDLVTETGRGDVYATNVWLGYSSTINTPLHKDPNPNLFVQLAGRKRVRIFEPAAWGGERRFREEEEMMVGEGRRRVEEIVWGVGGIRGWEVEVGPGDAVFIPKEWWHAVKGVGEGVAGSVNWWFR